MKKALWVLLVGMCTVYGACTKDSFIDSADARLLTSADTLRFDTVFTSTGSVTQIFTLTNNNNQKLRIDEVSLAGGNNSAFRINVNGLSGPVTGGQVLEANDSVFVFVTVNINPNAVAQPFVLRDSIKVSFNGNKRWIQLEAWGQNAHFLRNKKLSGNTTWTNDLPYVILGGLQVDTNASLTIDKGCRIYFHADAPLLVDGTLQVNGAAPDSSRVYFRSDRLDYPYSDYPAGWPGIYFRGTSISNRLQYAVIKNAYQGVVAQQPALDANPKLTLNECIIDNIYDAGVYGIASSVNARNCLISNCGKNIQLVYGGNYQFVHCTVPTIASSYISHKDPVLYVSDYVQSGGAVFTNPLTASFTNCIFWAEGSTADNEVVTGKQGGGPYSVSFTNCLWKVKTNPANVTANGIIANSNPAFDSVNTARNLYDFHLKAESPAINKGINTGIATDLDGKPRAAGLPDLGAYEKQ